jgi:2-alkyl-3-oxoalkanoate reductase
LEAGAQPGYDSVPALAGTTCAVTGAGGFIGQKLCDRLTAEGATVRGLDVDTAAADRVAATGAEFEHCDTTDPRSVRAALDGVQLVVHAAARVTDWGPMDEFVRVNVGGTRNVLDAAGELGCERVVHVSSVASFGYEHRTDLDEDALPRPCGIPYIDTKAASDALAVARARAGQQIAVVRPGDVYGPGSTQWSVRVLEAIKRRQFMLFGRGEGLMTPVFADDLVDALARALVVPEAAGKAFTAWDGHAVTAAEFFTHYARMLGRDSLPRLPRPLASAIGAAQELVAHANGKPPMFTRHAITFLSRRAAYSNRRAREVLGWEPRVPLAEGMRRTEEWFRTVGLLP